MAYAFKFDCYDLIDNVELDKYDRKIKDVRVIVVADTEPDARDAAATLVSRENYELTSIAELSELHRVD